MEGVKPPTAKVKTVIGTAIASVEPKTITACASFAEEPSLVATTPYYRTLPWLYPLYYVALFIPRQMDDDVQVCAPRTHDR